MRKSLLLTIGVLTTMLFGANAQQRGSVQTNSIADGPRTNLSTTVPGGIISTAPSNGPQFSIAGGCASDTLLFEDFQSQSIPFAWFNIDQDGLTDANARPAEYYVFQDLQTTLPGDTNYVAASSSWFTPPGVANNVLLTTAVTICDASVDLIWKSAPFEGPAYMDGYTVSVINATTLLQTVVAEFAEGDAAGNIGAGIVHTNFNGNNGVLQEWTVSLAPFVGQTIYIVFTHDSDDDNLILLDDIFVGIPPIGDVATSDIYRGTDYTIVPESQNQPITPSALMTNLGGTSVVINPTMTFDALLGGLSVYNNVETQGSLAGGTSSTFTANASGTLGLGAHLITAAGSSDELDPDPTNNSDTAFLSITDTIYGRDDNIVQGALSIGAGSSGFMGNQFEIFNTTNASSISFFLNNPTIGDTVFGGIYTMAGGVPSVLLLVTNLYIVTAADTAGALITLPILPPFGGTTALSPGNYVVGIQESTSSLSTLGYSTDNYIPGTTWIEFGGTWENSEFYAIEPAYIVRLNVCDAPESGWSFADNGLTVDFTDASTGSGLSAYLWDFGDGNTSTLQNPQHTYAANGTYTVCLTVTGSCGTDSSCASVNVVDPAPVNDDICDALPLVFGANGPFDATNATPQAGEPAPPAGTGIFTCQSQDGWCSFENGFDPNPVVNNSVWFTFEAPSSGNVTINTDNSYDTQVAVYSSATCDSLLSGNYTLEGANDDNPDFVVTLFSSEVTVTCLTPGATYYVQVDGYNGSEGTLNILLTDNLYAASASISSTGDPVCAGSTETLSTAMGDGFSYLWSTGDTTASAIISAGGNYNVLVTDSNGCTASDNIFIGDAVEPLVGFTSVPSLLTVDFSDVSTGSPSLWSWDFGDGNTSILQDPQHTYAAAGTYTVCLIAANGCGADTTCQSVTVTCPTPVVDWTHASAGFITDFTDASTGNNISNWLWDFGDGNTSTMQNPQHTYAALGTYTVCLTVVDDCGVDSSCASVLISNAVPVNDTCGGALPISCGDVISGDNLTATNVDAPEGGAGCAFSLGEGVWYTFVGDGSDVTLTTCSANTDFDTEIAVVSGDCNNFVCEVNNDDDFSCTGNQSTVNLTSVNGVTYYVYVGGWQDGNLGNFELSMTCAPPCSILSLTDVFTGDCDPVTNLYTQRVEVTYENAPATGTLDVNGQSFAITSSPQTVLLTDLWSDGLPVNVDASFSADGGCSLSVDSVFTAPESCIGGCDGDATILGLPTVFCENDPEVTIDAASLGGTYSGPGIIGDGDAASFVADSLPLAIPDNTTPGASANIQVSGLPAVTRLSSVCMDITHTWDGDLHVTLTNPTGTNVDLMARPGVPATGAGCSADNVSVTIVPGTGNDMEDVCLTVGPAGIFGEYTAHNGQDIASFWGSDPNGTWTVTVIDSASGDIGTLDNLTLNFGNPGVFSPAEAGPGTHQIIHTLENCSGCMDADTVEITVEPIPIAQWTSSANGLTVDFTDASLGSPANWLWDFGDGNTDTVQDPQHTYAAEGDYLVCLTVSNNCGTDSTCHTVSVTDVISIPNDTCAGALPINCGDVITGSTVGASADDAPIAGTGCALSLGNGVWYTFVGDGSNVTLTTCSGNTDFDTEIAVVSGDCNNYTCVTSNDNDASCAVDGLQSTVNFTSQNGVTYLIYVGAYSTFGSDGNFELSMTCAPGCSVDGITAGTPSACNPNDNTYTVDVTITYSNAPATGDLLINGQAFAITGSPQTETLTLTSNGSDVDVTAEFSDDSGCTATEVALFTAPDACNVNCAAGSTNLLDEDFDGCALPTGWTNNIIDGADGFFFALNSPDADNAGNIDGTCMAMFDDDAIGSGAAFSTVSLETPVIDLSNSTSTSLEFDYSYYHLNSSFFNVDVWDGSAWVNVLAVNADAPGDWGSGPTPHASIDISAYTNADFQVRFVYDDGDGWNWWVAIDNVVICGVEIITDINAAINSSLNIYPNPSQGDITLELNGFETDATINVVDVTGRTVFSEATFIGNSFRKTLNLDVVTGTYLLQLVTEEGVATRKLEIK